VVDTVPYSNYDPLLTGDDKFDQASADARGLVDKYNALFESAMNGLTNIANTVAGLITQPPDPLAPPTLPTFQAPPGFGDLPSLPDIVTFPTVGDFSAPAWVNLPKPDLPDLSGIDLSDIATAFPDKPTIDTDIPLLTVPDIPAFDPGFTLASPPSMPNPTYPTAPNVEATLPSFPEPPDLSAYLKSVPDAPVINYPTPPSASIPELSVSPPSPALPSPALPDVPSLSAFESRVKTAVEDSILDMLARAQLDAEYERASYEAMLDREALSAGLALGQLQDVWASQGFLMPPGVQFQQEINLRADFERKARQASREIYVKRKELELQVRQAALQAGNQMTDLDVRLYDIANRLLFEAASQARQHSLAAYDIAVKAAQLDVSVFEAQIRAFSARLEGYRTQWQGYQAILQGETAKIDAYRAQVEAIASQAQLGRAQAELYRAQVGAKTDIAKVAAELDRLRFDAWSTIVEAEVKKLQGVASWGAIMQAQASAINAKAQAYRAEVDGVTRRAEAEARLANLKLDAQKLLIQTYEAAVRGESARVQAKATIQQSRAGIFRDLAQYAVQKAQAAATTAQAEAQVNTARIQAVASAYTAKLNAHASTANAQAAYYGALSSLISAHKAKSDIEVAHYRATLDAQVTLFRAQAEYNNALYSRALAAWSDAMNRAYRVAEASITKLSDGARHASTIAAAALQGTFVSYQVQESKTLQTLRRWSYALTNSLSESYQASI